MHLWINAAASFHKCTLFRIEINLLTIGIKGHLQIGCNNISRPAFDMMSFQEMHQFAIFK